MPSRVHQEILLYCVIEQPLSSVMWDLPCFVTLVQLMGLSVVTTWLGLYGHILLKPTKLLGNLPGLGKFLVSRFLRFRCVASVAAAMPSSPCPCPGCRLA